ncbi:MAG: S4 domain-containing protein YaaA [Erysipelotrichaceae bacterium]|nr:S4 domain-containing protein YaaA [Erysipelotrichaceae bacterium]
MTKIDRDYIELQQLLKKEDIVNSGGEAKILIKEGNIKVNGEIETRRGRKLYPNDVVEVGNRKIVIE